MKLFILLMGLVASTLTAASQRCASSDYLGFDFWLGDWEVKTKDGKIAGMNRIEKINPCLIIENWVGVKGLRGSSMNYYDPGKQKWIQHWVSGDGTIIHLEGKTKDKTLKMEGSIFYAKNKKTLPFRGEWTLLADKRVRQYFEQQDVQSKKWNPWFEGFYKKATQGKK